MVCQPEASLSLTVRTTLPSAFISTSTLLTPAALRRPSQSSSSSQTFEMETLVVSFANVFTIVVPLTFVS